MEKTKVKVVVSKIMDSAVYRRMPLRLRMSLLSRFLKRYPDLFKDEGYEGYEGYEGGTEIGYESSWREIFLAKEKDN